MGVHTSWNIISHLILSYPNSPSAIERKERTLEALATLPTVEISYKSNVDILQRIKVIIKKLW